ncbi:tRNA-specific adenosine deaminase [Emydomyces testavorans]|uniref:tRNA-specific adenosine deaminase n=1 Tax=Emydomyces testavorans TaxID=2070801 RepID=A0AAF0IHX2_9EURO|nr:tRNA-specific adenosine deaminase [Emydomyces testavorans]
MGSNGASLKYRIASLVHSHFDALPQRCKPSIRPNGTRKWIPLSGIVLVTGENTPEESLTCVALATGAKCLSSSQIPLCQGVVLHDSHAEVLALRAFNYWLLKECQSMLMHNYESGPCGGNGVLHQSRDDGFSTGSLFLEWRNSNAFMSHSDSWGLWPPIKIKNDVRIWMYCTCAPCGDASMELCMAAQEDPTPWAVPVPNANATEIESGLMEKVLDGRAHFSVLGAVRRKPSRPDAQPTLSKSCSDKLAAKQVTSLLSFPASLLIAPSPNAYLANLLLPENEINHRACERSFGNGERGRLRQLNIQKWEDGSHTDAYYAFFPFNVRSLPMDQVDNLWKFARQTGANLRPNKVGNISAVWAATPSFGEKPAHTSFSQGQTPLSRHASRMSLKQFPTNITETLINGVRQGYHISSLDARKASALSRAKMWDLLRETIRLFPDGSDARMDALPLDENQPSGNTGVSEVETRTQLTRLRDCVLSAPTYSSMKCAAAETSLLHLRNKVLADVRRVLGNWIENRGDEQWGLIDTAHSCSC